MQSTWWETLKKMVHDCVTENDGQSYCPVRILGDSLSLLSIPIFICGAVIALINGKFDPVAFAKAFAILMSGLGALGLGVAVKAFTDSK